MNLFIRALCAWALASIIGGQKLIAQDVWKVNAHAELPVLKSGKLFQEIFYECSKDTNVSIQFACYKMGQPGDSLLVYKNYKKKIELKKGVHVIQVALAPKEKTDFLLAAFKEACLKTGQMPPGEYSIHLAIISGADHLFRRRLLFRVDSNLNAYSSLRRELEGASLPLLKQGSTLLKKPLGASGLLGQVTRKAERVAKRHGLIGRTVDADSRRIINFFYQDWYVGRYTLDLKQPLSAQVDDAGKRGVAGVTQSVSSELDNYQSLFGQFRTLQKEARQEQELTGTIAIAGNFASAQPEYSEQEDNFYEMRAQLQAPIFDIPVGVEAYYTTQDRNRVAKASYFHFYYDAAKAKEELLKLIGGYNQAYSQTVARGQGMDQIYGSYLGALKSQGNLLASGLAKSYGVPVTTDEHGMFQIDTTGARAVIMDQLKKEAAHAKDSMSSVSDSAEGYKQTLAIQDSCEQRYQQMLTKYEDLKALQGKALHYQQLLEQYKNTSHFDSLLAYDKVRDLENADELTYKQLAKKAGHLLPEGKAKTGLAGLTNLDAGIFNKDLSKYTAAGQQIKGLDVGYDIGFCQVGVMVGTTQYISRSGTPDNYTSYSARVLTQPFKHHEVGLVYYGYSPNRNASIDKDFFKNVNIALPTFMEPMHILSATYTGKVGSDFLVTGEAATSFRKNETGKLVQALDADRLAWNLNVEGPIPNTPLSVHAGYEHGGKEFQNSTLPINISGTDRYRVGAIAELFKGFLRAGVEFNHMEQSSFASKGSNNRWGFELSTHSKRYPSIALSYKPFASFRAFEDTLHVPQRPLIGAVWTGKGTYQIKKKGHSWRFNIIYNQSSSLLLDTLSYRSTMMQAGCMYSDRIWSVQVFAGKTLSHATGQEFNPAHQDVSFINLQGSRVIHERLSITGGSELGVAAFGLTRLGANTGAFYRLKIWPVALRAFYRFSTYKLEAQSPWKPIHMGGLELSCDIRAKLGRKH